jgi:hypothetical protein
MASHQNKELRMATRISALEAKRRTESDQALLVCGYDDEQKCRGFDIAGSITYKQFQTRLPSLPKSTELIFFCA